jgi:hypothetical protein
MRSSSPRDLAVRWSPPMASPTVVLAIEITYLRNKLRDRSALALAFSQTCSRQRSKRGTWDRSPRQKTILVDRAPGALAEADPVGGWHRRALRKGDMTLRRSVRLCRRPNLRPSVSLEGS